MIKFINHLYFVMSTAILLTINATAKNKNYVPPPAATLDTYRAYDIPIPKDRRSDCIQSYTFSEGFSKEKLQQQYKKWKQNNSGTYTYIFQRPYNDTTYILFIKNNKIEKATYENCWKRYGKYGKQMIREEKKCKYKITSKSYIIKSELPIYHKKKPFIIDRMLEEVLKNDINESQYCLHPQVQLTFDDKYGYIDTYIETRPNCNCLPRPLQYKSFFYYGLLMLPKETEFTDEVVTKILSLYDKAKECEQKQTSPKQNRDQNLTTIEKEVGKVKLECLDKYLVWDKNESK